MKLEIYQNYVYGSYFLTQSKYIACEKTAYHYTGKKDRQWQFGNMNSFLAVYPRGLSDKNNFSYLWRDPFLWNMEVLKIKLESSIPIYLKLTIPTYWYLKLCELQRERPAHCPFKMSFTPQLTLCIDMLQLTIWKVSPFFTNLVYHHKNFGKKYNHGTIAHISWLFIEKVFGICCKQMSPFIK